METKTIQTGVLYRKATLESVAGDVGQLVVASISSEEPYQRQFGLEILSHKPNAVDLDRVHRGTVPFLKDHDTTQFIGKIKNVRLESGRAIATIQMGESDLACETFQEIKNGTRTEVSVGYQVNEMEPLADREEGTFLVTSWTLLEVSSVAVPADPSVGFGRSFDNKTVKTVIHERGNKMEDEKLKKKDVLEILAIGKAHGFSNEAEKAIEKDVSVEQFRSEVLARMAKRQSPISTEDPEMEMLGMSQREIKKYSFLRAAEASISGNWNKAGLELEAHRSIEKQMGPTQSGKTTAFYVPADVLTRDLTTGGSGANLTGNQLLPGQYIEFLRNDSKTIEAGARTLSGLSSDVDIPRGTAASVGYWIGEGDDTTESTPTYDQVPLAFKTVSGWVDITRKMRIQSSLDIENLIRADLAVTLGTGLDLGALSGSGATNQPTGILNTTGINTVTFATAGTPTFGEIVDMETAVAVDNGLVGQLSYMINATLHGTLKQTQKVAGEAAMIIQDGKMNGYPVHVTNQMPANTILFGNWNDLLIGTFGPGVEFLADTSTLSTSGGLRLVAFLSCDVALRHPESFCSGA